MIFHEIYGCYYHAVAKAIRAAQNGTLDEKELRRISDETAFSESFLTIIPALREQKWQLFGKDWSTPIRHKPTMPLSELQRRWLKAITLDPRFRLFDIEVEGLDDVAPLFTPEDFVVFDRYTDGDPYDDPCYQQVFRTVRQAIRERRQITMQYETRKGVSRTMTCRPKRLEYSEKDDKFRLIVRNRDVGSVNLQRIRACKLTEVTERNTVQRRRPHEETMVFIVTDERNALERAMLHFAHFEKEAERIDDLHYRVTLKYSTSDETELLIRILSFGPLIQVLEPEGMVESIKERIKKQLRCGL